MRQYTSHMISLICAVSLISFLVVFFQAYHAPLFIDDAHWPIQNGRVLYDGLAMVNLYPQCTENFTWPVYWPLLPGRIFTSLLHPETLIGIRLYGMAKYLSCIFLLSGLSYVLFKRRISFVLLLSAFSALLSIGFLPVIMTLDRPETAIVTGALLLFAYTYISWKHPIAGKTAIAWALCYAATLSWLLSLHPKTQALLPYIWVLAFATKLHTPKAKFLLYAGVAIMSLACIQQWKMHSTCTSYPHIEDVLKNYSLLPRDAWERPDYFADNVLENLKKSPKRYVPALEHSNNYLGFMPQEGFSNQANPLLLRLTNYYNLTLLMGLGCALLLGFVACFISPALPKTSFYKKLLSKELWIPLTLLLPVLVVLGMRQSQSVAKEAGLFMCLTAFALIWLTYKNNFHDKYTRTIRVILCVIIMGGLINHVTFYTGWHHFFHYTSTPKNFTHGAYKHDPYNRLQGIFDSPKRNQAFVRFAKRCDITTDTNTRHLVIDNWSYMPFYKTTRPFYGQTLFNKKVPNGNFIKFLRDNNSDGAIGLCFAFPKQLKKIAVKRNGMCCVSKRSLQKM